VISNRCLVCTAVRIGFVDASLSVRRIAQRGAPGTYDFIAAVLKR